MDIKDLPILYADLLAIDRALIIAEGGIEDYVRAVEQTCERVVDLLQEIEITVLFSGNRPAYTELKQLEADVSAIGNLS